MFASLLSGVEVRNPCPGHCTVPPPSTNQPIPPPQEEDPAEDESDADEDARDEVSLGVDSEGLKLAAVMGIAGAGGLEVRSEGANDQEQADDTSEEDDGDVCSSSGEEDDVDQPEDVGSKKAKHTELEVTNQAACELLLRTLDTARLQKDGDFLELVRGIRDRASILNGTLMSQVR